MKLSFRAKKANENFKLQFPDLQTQKFRGRLRWSLPRSHPLDKLRRPRAPSGGVLGLSHPSKSSQVNLQKLGTRDKGGNCCTADHLCGRTTRGSTLTLETWRSCPSDSRFAFGGRFRVNVLDGYGKFLILKLPMA